MNRKQKNQNVLADVDPTILRAAKIFSGEARPYLRSSTLLPDSKGNIANPSKLAELAELKAESQDGNLTGRIFAIGELALRRAFWPPNREALDKGGAVDKVLKVVDTLLEEQQKQKDNLTPVEDIITFDPETLPPILPEHQNHKK